MDEFDKFWSQWPLKVAKAAAFRAFQRARKVAPVETIMDGLKKYTASKPEWQAWAHASTWLNGRRWEDQLSVTARAPATTDWDFLWRWRLRNYKPGGFWNCTWGARPEDGGTDIPRAILAEWRSANPEK